MKSSSGSCEGLFLGMIVGAFIGAIIGYFVTWAVIGEPPVSQIGSGLSFYFFLDTGLIAKFLGACTGLAIGAITGGFVGAVAGARRT